MTTMNYQYDPLDFSNPDDDPLLHPCCRIIIKAFQRNVSLIKDDIKLETIYTSAAKGTLSDLSKVNKEDTILILKILKYDNEQLKNLQDLATSSEAYDIGDERFPLISLIHHLEEKCTTCDK